MGEDGGSGGGGGDAGGLTHLSPGARSHSETHPHEPVPGDTRVVHAGTRNIQHPVVGHGGNRSDPRVTHLHFLHIYYSTCLLASCRLTSAQHCPDVLARHVGVARYCTEA